MIPFGVAVGLHLLTTLFNGRFAIIKRHYYYLDDSSRTVSQTASNGIGSTSSGRASSDNALSKVHQSDRLENSWKICFKSTNQNTYLVKL